MIVQPLAFQNFQKGLQATHGTLTRSEASIHECCTLMCLIQQGILLNSHNRTDDYRNSLDMNPATLSKQNSTFFFCLKLGIKQGEKAPWKNIPFPTLRVKKSAPVTSNMDISFSSL